MKQVLARVFEDPEATLVLFQELWPEMVGQDLSRFTRPSAWDGCELVIDVPAEVWAEHLMTVRELFLDRINQYWRRPLVETIRFRIGLMQ